MSKYTRLERCRLSGSETLIPVLDLGNQALTGVFPRSREEPVTTGPLRLVWCPDFWAASARPFVQSGRNVR